MLLLPILFLLAFAISSTTSAMDVAACKECVAAPGSCIYCSTMTASKDNVAATPSSFSSPSTSPSIRGADVKEQLPNENDSINDQQTEGICQCDGEYCDDAMAFTDEWECSEVGGDSLLLMLPILLILCCLCGLMAWICRKSHTGELEVTPGPM